MEVKLKIVNPLMVILMVVGWKGTREKHDNPELDIGDV